MAGLSRIIAKELSSMLGITDNPKFNPMFKQTDEVLEDVFDTSSNPNSATIAEFYSPLESAIDNAAIGKQGTRGENIEAFVRKRAPKVTQGELEYREFSLDPAKKYTRGLAQQESMEPLSIKAVRQSPENAREQRQYDLLDSEVGYEEVAIDVIGKDLGLSTHYGGSNLAHARYSLRKKPASSEDVMKKDIKSYILIEELQSDAIQNMSKNPTKDVNKLLDNFKKDFDSDMEDIAFKPQFQSSEKLIEDYKDFVLNDFIPLVSNKKLSEEKAFESLTKMFTDRGYNNTIMIPGQPFKALKKMFDNMSADNAIYDFKEKDKLLDSITNAASFFIGSMKNIVGKKDTPLTSLTDSVRVLLQSIIADAKSKGIDEIVLPPIEKLAEKRFGTSGGKTYRKAITKGSGFHNTYVVAFDKALKQLQAELGNQIKVGTKDLNYAGPITTERITTGTRAARKKTKPVKGKPIILKGKSINIKDLKLAPNKVKLRFNKGGLVKGLMSR
jgi:hypothetical protein